MASWYLDEGLVTFRSQWRQLHPGSTVYTIGDTSHSADPDKSQHAPDRGGSAPGDDRGEVDAVDVMPGKGVDGHDLDDLFEDLWRSRDPRILYVIHRDKIVSSVVSPWKIRPYGGHYHGHVHLSVNDVYDANTSPWKIGDQPVANPPLLDLDGRLPRYVKGMEDSAFDGYDGIKRAQRLLNWLDSSTADLDPDGVYGAKTAAKLKAFMTAAGGGGTTTNGSIIGIPEWRKLLGIYQPAKASI